MWVCYHSNSLPCKQAQGYESLPFTELWSREKNTKTHCYQDPTYLMHYSYGAECISKFKSNWLGYVEDSI